MGGPSRAALAPVAAEFARKHRDVEIEVVATNRPISLVEEGFDLAVTFMGVNEDSSLVARKLQSAYHHCCASPAYLAEYGVPKTPDDFGTHEWVVFSEVRDVAWRFERDRVVRRVAVGGRLRVNSLWMAHDAALRGVGIASLPSFLCGADIRSGRLVSLFPDWHVNRTEMRIVYPSSRHLAPRVRMFSDALVEGYNASLELSQIVKPSRRVTSKRDLARRRTARPR